MLAHFRMVITVKRVVDAVSRHTTVDPREQPIDSVDALLFWINKVCLLMRDDVERAQLKLKGSDESAVVPEMEDLYEELSDGQCLCAMVSWYRPRELHIEDVCFNDQMSIPDCQYNITLLQQFCIQSLPWNPFHFEIEDILYLHDSFQMNINVFLADLFEIFEPAPIVSVQPEPVASPRRFVPIHAISDLRAANQAARPQHPPRSSRHPFMNVRVAQHDTPRSVSAMSQMSQDSLMNNSRTLDSRRGGSLRYSQGPDGYSPNVTNFMRLQQHESGHEAGSPGGSPYGRSDSMPAASIRLQLEEKRRLHEKQKALQSTLSESERAEKGKAAFFALMNNQAAVDSPNNRLIDRLGQKLEDLEQKVNQINLQNEQRIPRALSQPSVYQEMMPMNPYVTLPHYPAANQPIYGQPQQQQQMYDYYQQQQAPTYASPQNMMRNSISNGMLNQIGYGQQPQASQPPYYGADYSMQQATMYPPAQPENSPLPYSATMNPSTGFHLMHQSAHASTGLSLSPSPALPPSASASVSQQQQPSFAPPVSFNYPMSAENTPPTAAGSSLAAAPDNGTNQGNSSFRLHSNPGVSNNYDPPLEINRNLTNWGISYRQTNALPRQRRTWENETFVKSDLDLVNQKEFVPNISNEQNEPMIMQKAASVIGSMRRTRDSVDDDNQQEERLSDEPHVMMAAAMQPSPPRDPSNNPETQNNSGNTGFVVSTDDQAAANFDRIAAERREAKKAALLAKTMKRQEERDNKVDVIEQRNYEKRMAEMAKKEMNEQRKLEKELQRQRILEEHRRKKEENEKGNTLEVASARTPGRHQSQPPFSRTQSQMSESMFIDRGGGRAPRTRGQSSVEQQRPVVASLQEPTHKLFAKAQTKTNRGLIINALTYSVFPGAVNGTTRNKTMSDMASSSAIHFLLLFRDQKCQYRGLYTWDEVSDTVYKISGQGPPKCTEDMMKLMFKYDSGGKTFTQIPTKHLSATIDGFSIQDQYWQKARIPHSGAASHRDN
ncbi:hypothetical protein WR25_09665 isoform D [Diploscapter pachys]|nr:hypothetical protein WR25_09665 isoform B [Diploscapter pachys]PAV70086.1 hypothetical protein WR25_09665 isoform C [Diploscapter pachys]PAV70087.1 hypothetical protein WR25_09665 isoform D [Diploscapter pachys]